MLIVIPLHFPDVSSLALLVIPYVVEQNSEITLIFLLPCYFQTFVILTLVHMIQKLGNLLCFCIFHIRASVRDRLRWKGDGPDWLSRHELSDSYIHQT